MQVEIKVALNFLLSFMYDKLPRRRVNIFGDELQKYLLVKLANKSQHLADIETNCLSINFKSFNGDDIVDPSLLAAAKDAAIDIYEILECLPNRLKLYIQPGFVFYAILNAMNEFEEMKVLFNEKPSLASPSNEFLLNKPDLVSSNNKPVSNKLNLTSLLDVKPFQPAVVTNMTNDCLTQVHSPVENQLSLNQANSSSDYFTTATFAQTKFGTTKKKNTIFSPTNSQRTAKLQNPKMQSTEFSNYIKTRTELKNLLSNRQQSIESNTNDTNNIEISNVLMKNFNDLHMDNATIAAKLEILFQQQQLQQQQQQQSQLQNQSPIISPASSSSSVSSNYDLFSNSTHDELEDNLINSYFSPLLSSASSSATFLTPSALSNSLLTFQNSKHFADLTNPTDFKFESDN